VRLGGAELVSSICRPRPPSGSFTPIIARSPALHAPPATSATSHGRRAPSLWRTATTREPSPTSASAPSPSSIRAPRRRVADAPALEHRHAGLWSGAAQVERGAEPHQTTADDHDRTRSRSHARAQSWRSLGSMTTRPLPFHRTGGESLHDEALAEEVED